MRKRGRTDENQTEIVNVLRRAGAGVLITSMLGDGAVDIIAGYRGVNYMMEIKDGKKPPSQRTLTPDEARFHEKWPGQICVVNSAEEALKAIGAWKPND